MRIAIDARYLTDTYSGIGRYSENLLNALGRLDQQNRYFVFVHRSFNRRLKTGDNFEIVPVKHRPMSLNTFFRFGQRLRRRVRCDFLHSLAPIAPLFAPPRYLLTIHDIHPFNLEETGYQAAHDVNYLAGMVYRATFPRIIQSAEWIITVSHATRQRLIELFPEVRHESMVVHSGVGPQFHQIPEPQVAQLVVKRLNLPPQFLLYVGTAQPNKNLPMMIRAFHELRGRYPEEFGNLHFLMVVGKDKRFAECQRLIQALKLDDRIRTLGPITEEEHRVLLARARVLFSVTSGEGFGFPILEAQAAGLPVLASNDAATPEVAGRAAILVDPRNFQQVVENLAFLLRDEEARKTLIEAGRENAERFTWDLTAQKVLEIYTLLL